MPGPTLLQPAGRENFCTNPLLHLEVRKEVSPAKDLHGISATNGIGHST
jgi:hypothetical protein